MVVQQPRPPGLKFKPFDLGAEHPGFKDSSSFSDSAAARRAAPG